MHGWRFQRCLYCGCGLRQSVEQIRDLVDIALVFILFNLVLTSSYSTARDLLLRLITSWPASILLNVWCINLQLYPSLAWTSSQIWKEDGFIFVHLTECERGFSWCRLGLAAWSLLYSLRVGSSHWDCWYLQCCQSLPPIGCWPVTCPSLGLLLVWILLPEDI